MFKNKLFKYFSLELLKSFSVILVTLSFIIWFNQAARYLDLVTENGNPINVYLIFVFFQFPKIFSQLFLFSLLVSLFYTITKYIILFINIYSIQYILLLVMEILVIVLQTKLVE